MNEIIKALKEVSELLSWQVTTLIILFMVRRHLGTVFNGIQSLLNRTTKLVINGKTVTLEAAAEIIKEQKQAIKHSKQENFILKKELSDYNAGAVQVMPKEILTAKGNILEPIFRKMGAQTMAGNKDNIKPKYPDDPEKERWGGLSINNEKHLTASVVATENNDNLYKITLSVVSINTAKPLIGKVTFHLHPTFIHAHRTIEAVNGMAQLHLIAYGAFTVGVETEDGTKLELDLSEDTRFPQNFRSR